MKIVFNVQETLDLVMTALRSPGGCNLLPEAMDTDNVVVRLALDDGMIVGVEVTDEPDEESKKVA